MKQQAFAMLAALAFAVPAFAQTKGQEAKPSVKTEKLWKIECSGISGWGAASQAARVSSILNKHKSIKNLIFDTTGVGYFEKKSKDDPTVDDLNDALEDGRAGRVRVSSLKEVDAEVPAVVYEVAVSGLGWMGTAIETRDVLSKIDGVIRVHPNGLNGKALVLVRDEDKVDSDAVKEALAKTEKLRFRKMKKTKI